jgi:hypothetical protein
MAAQAGVDLDSGGVCPMALCDETDLHNLLTFAGRFSASHSPGEAGRLRASLAAENGWASLRLEMAGPPPRQGVDYFSPRSGMAPPATGLELAACRSIVQRVGGRLRAAEAVQGRVALLIDLPVARGNG